MRSPVSPSTGSFEPALPQAWAAIAPGAAAMTVAGVQSLSLGALAGAGHFSATDSLHALLTELFCMGLAVAAAGWMLPARRLRPLFVLAAFGSAGLNLAAAFVQGRAIIAVMGAEGGLSGLLVWITLGMLARRANPEPWAAGFFMIQSVGQLIVGAVGAAVILPVLGPMGGVVLAAGVLLASSLAAFALPSSYPALSSTGPPSRRGSLGLLALFLFVCGSAGAWFGMRGLLVGYHLPEALGGVIVIANLVGQIAGSAAGVFTTRRLSDARAFVLASLLGAAAWTTLLLHPLAVLFVAAYALTGFASILMGTRLFSFLNGQDPSRRAAQISAVAQLTGAALGPALGLGLVGSIGLAFGCLVVVAVLQRPQGRLSPTPQPAGQAPR